MTADDVDGLGEVLDSVADDRSVRALVLTGAGEKTFCSGASLDEMESGRMSGALFDTLTGKLATLAVPTIARIAGDLYGGGAELALCCDFRIGARGVRLSVPAARLGICYPPGGASRYVARLGLGVSSRILLASEKLEADELLRVGYLTHLVERDALDARVDSLAADLAELAPLAVRSMKRMLLAISGGNPDPGELERLVDVCSSSDDLAEGLRAWREGREPDFRGR